MLRRKRVADDAASAGVGPAAEHRGQATGGRAASRPKLSLEEAVFGSGAASAAETGVLVSDANVLICGSHTYTIALVAFNSSPV